MLPVKLLMYNVARKKDANNAKTKILPLADRPTNVNNCCNSFNVK